MARFSLSAADQLVLDAALNKSSRYKELLINLLISPVMHTPPGIKGSLIMAIDYYYSKTLTPNQENIIDSLVDFIVSNNYEAMEGLVDTDLITTMKQLINNPDNNTDDKLHKAWLAFLTNTVGPPTKIPPRP